MTNRIGVRSVFAFLFLSTFVSTAQAQTPSDEAKDHYRKGTAAYNLGKYAEAAQEYELSYSATLDPALLFNVAQAYRLAGDRRRALTAYKSYLRSAPDGDRRDLAEARVKEIESALNYDDPFSGGDSPAPPKPAPAPPPAPDPKSVRHSPVMEADAPPPVPGQNPVLVTTTAASQSPPSPPPIYRRWPFWAAVGAVVLAIIVVVAAESGSSSPSAPQTTYGTMRF